MQTTEPKPHLAMSSVEFIALGGFSLCVAWICMTFFWLFCEFPPDASRASRDLLQLIIFTCVALGYVLLHFLAKRSGFNLFSQVAIAVILVCSIAQPLILLAMLNGVHIPLVVVCIANAMAGLAAAALVTCWLDVLSRLQHASYARFCGLGFVFGSFLLCLTTSVAFNMQPLIAALCALCTVGLVIYTSRNADANDERAPLEQVADPWMFTKEIEPSFFVFSMVFALNFVFLFNSGQQYVLYGMIAIIPGALVIAILGILRKSFSVTVLQRVLLAVTVLGCILLPFTEGVLQIACSCLVMAAWAAFMSSNYAFIVMKCITHQYAPLFRQAPARLAAPAFGFAVGWALAAVLTLLFGEHDYVFTIVHLALVVLLVFVVMAFFPVGSHHPAGGGLPEENAVKQSVVPVQMNESELLERRCEAIAKLYQLSPRESDVLVYLARGRNASWIQDELVISPHTVKSHIYNIYRKLDIHSQQKLMSFVEEFPLNM